jgi:membrane protease YdiL (CAAX protease family)
MFLAVASLLRLGLGKAASTSAVESQVVLKSVLVLVALAGWKLLGRPLGEMGWRRAAWWHRSYLPWYVLAAASMMGGSVASMFIGIRHPIASQMSFLQIVLAIWLLSSFSEEVYVRGLVQSWVSDREETSGINSAVGPAVVSSALVFAAMHVPLMWSPAGVKGGLAIVLATLGVGWSCAVLRDRSGSLGPAIVCHILGNVAGVPGGILGVILYRLIYGRLPEILTSG